MVFPTIESKEHNNDSIKEKSYGTSNKTRPQQLSKTKARQFSVEGG